MAPAGSAFAAPILTSPAGTEYTGEIHATMERGSSSIMKAGVEETCTEPTVTGTVILNNSTETEGAASVISSGSASTPCSIDIRTITPGRLTINDADEVFTKESRIELKVTGLGISCFYGAETGSVKIGTFTGGTPARLDVSTTTLQREAGSNTTFCAPTGTWTGTYVVTTPVTLLLT